MSARLVHIACPDADVAHALAHSLVDARLAACVSVLAPQTSIYRWNGAVERADEVALFAKTWSDRVEALVAHVVARHPYELPEVIAVEAGSGLDRYVDWIQTETRIPAE